MSSPAQPAVSPHHHAEDEMLVRFSVQQRIEHVAIMLLFTALSVTGFPQKFPTWSFSGWLVDLMGGVALTRTMHRVIGVAFTVMFVIHIGTVLLGVFRRATPLSVVPRRRDFKDAIQTLKYYLGLASEPARFDRFDYRQKFEYWGLAFGSVVMIFTGFILLYPIQVASFLPGQLIPASKLMHSSEGLMAFLIVILWHIYNAHLNPDVFPFDTSIFTGKISRERMEKEHPLELERRDEAEPKSPKGSA